LLDLHLVQNLQTLENPQHESSTPNPKKLNPEPNAQQQLLLHQREAAVDDL
jgi:hypothetical protein